MSFDPLNLRVTKLPKSRWVLIENYNGPDSFSDPERNVRGLTCQLVDILSRKALQLRSNEIGSFTGIRQEPSCHRVLYRSSG